MQRPVRRAAKDRNFRSRGTALTRPSAAAVPRGAEDRNLRATTRPRARSRPLDRDHRQRYRWYAPMTADSGRFRNRVSGPRPGDTNQIMYSWWKSETQAGRPFRPIDLAKKADVSYSAPTNAIPRYRDGRVPATSTAGLSPRAVARIHVMLHRALRDATKLRYIPTNPAASAEYPRAEKRALRR
jgi:hypothetical protein